MSTSSMRSLSQSSSRSGSGRESSADSTERMRGLCTINRRDYDEPTGTNVPSNTTGFKRDEGCVTFTSYCIDVVNDVSKELMKHKPDSKQSTTKPYENLIKQITTKLKPKVESEEDSDIHAYSPNKSNIDTQDNMDIKCRRSPDKKICRKRKIKQINGYQSEHSTDEDVMPFEDCAYNDKHTKRDSHNTKSKNRTREYITESYKPSKISCKYSTLDDSELEYSSSQESFVMKRPLGDANDDINYNKANNNSRLRSNHRRHLASTYDEFAKKCNDNISKSRGNASRNRHERREYDENKFGANCHREIYDKCIIPLEDLSDCTTVFECDSSVASVDPPLQKHQKQRMNHRHHERNQCKNERLSYSPQKHRRQVQIKKYASTAKKSPNFGYIDYPVSPVCCKTIEDDGFIDCCQNLSRYKACAVSINPKQREGSPKSRDNEESHDKAITKCVRFLIPDECTSKEIEKYTEMESKPNVVFKEITPAVEEVVNDVENCVETGSDTSSTLSLKRLIVGLHTRLKEKKLNHQKPLDVKTKHLKQLPLHVNSTCSINELLEIHKTEENHSIQIPSEQEPFQSYRSSQPTPHVRTNATTFGNRLEKPKTYTLSSHSLLKNDIDICETSTPNIQIKDDLPSMNVVEYTTKNVPMQRIDILNQISDKQYSFQSNTIPQTSESKFLTSIATTQDNLNPQKISERESSVKPHQTYNINDGGFVTPNIPVNQIPQQISENYSPPQSYLKHHIETAKPIVPVYKSNTRANVPIYDNKYLQQKQSQSCQSHPTRESNASEYLNIPINDNRPSQPVQDQLQQQIAEKCSSIQHHPKQHVDVHDQHVTNAQEYLEPTLQMQTKELSYHPQRKHQHHTDEYRKKYAKFNHNHPSYQLPHKQSTFPSYFGHNIVVPEYAKMNSSRDDKESPRIIPTNKIHQSCEYSKPDQNNGQSSFPFQRPTMYTGAGKHNEIVSESRELSNNAYSPNDQGIFTICQSKSARNKILYSPVKLSRAVATVTSTAMRNNPEQVSDQVSRDRETRSYQPDLEPINEERISIKRSGNLEEIPYIPPRETNSAGKKISDLHLDQQTYLTSRSGDHLFEDNVDECLRKESQKKCLGSSSTIDQAVHESKLRSTGCFEAFLKTVDRWTTGSRESNEQDKLNEMRTSISQDTTLGKCNSGFVEDNMNFDSAHVPLNNKQSEQYKTLKSTSLENGKLISPVKKTSILTTGSYGNRNIPSAISRSLDNTFINRPQPTSQPTQTSLGKQNGHKVFNYGKNPNAQVIKNSLGQEYHQSTQNHYSNRQCFDNFNRRNESSRRCVQEINRDHNINSLLPNILKSNTQPTIEHISPFLREDCPQNIQPVNNLITSRRCNNQRTGPAPMEYSPLGHVSGRYCNNNENRYQRHRHCPSDRILEDICYNKQQQNNHELTKFVYENNNLSRNNNKKDQMLKHKKSVLNNESEENRNDINQAIEEESSLIVQLGLKINHSILDNHDSTNLTEVQQPNDTEHRETKKEKEKENTDNQARIINESGDTAKVNQQAKQVVGESLDPLLVSTNQVNIENEQETSKEEPIVEMVDNNLTKEIKSEPLYEEDVIIK